jgi:hypothetical protein
MTKGLVYVNVVDARMHLVKNVIAYCVMIGYGIITRSSQETYSCYSNERHRASQV